MRIGTRGSTLALWQANTVAQMVRDAGGPVCEIVIIRTSGDESAGPPEPPRVAAADDGPGPPPNIKRMFVKEIEEALVEGRIDAAVHSAKDLPGHLPPGLFIAAALAREDPRDAVLLPAPGTARDFDDVKRVLDRARIGTSSVRRVAQLRAVFRAATFAPLRGNVDTRLRKLDAGDCDAIVLAAAGVKRLGLAARLSVLLPVEVCVPAPAQGIVAVEMSQQARPALVDAVRRISDTDAEAALAAERAVVVALGGNCQMPLGVLAHLDGQDLTVRGVVAALDGTTIIRAVAHGRRGGGAAAGDKLAAQLLAKGAGELLK